MFTTQTIATIDNSFRKLIQRQNYEKYVLTIINRSEGIFRDISFDRIESQSHGESDFIDSKGQRYDAKLLFDKKQGALIGEAKNELTEWLQAMVDEKTEFGDVIRNRKTFPVTDTKLYQVMKDRLASVKPDEHAIFFIPFPIVDEYKGSVFLQFATDFLQAVYDKLVEEDLLGWRKLYFIYPDGVPNEYVLRDGHMHREYIVCEELDDFIVYETTLKKDKSF